MVIAVKEEGTERVTDIEISINNPTNIIHSMDNEGIDITWKLKCKKKRITKAHIKGTKGHHHSPTGQATNYFYQTMLMLLFLLLGFQL